MPGTLLEDLLYIGVATAAVGVFALLALMTFVREHHRRQRPRH